MATFTELSAPATADTPAPPADAPTASFLSKLTPLIPSFSTLTEHTSDVWSRSRPWSEFLNTSQFHAPSPPELFDRVRENAHYYAFNYLVILLVMSVLTILTSPLAFLGGVFIVAAYIYLFFMNPDPLVLGGVTIDNNVKGVVVMGFSLIVLWLTGAGATFTLLVAAVGVISLGHAAIRRPPGEADFETAYTPATV